MENTIYNKVGKGYNTTRKADPYIAGRMCELLAPVPDGLYLDVGCGTGNYLTAFAQRGLNFYGVDPSEVMLQEARSKHSGATFIHAAVEHLPLSDATFDGVTAMFTMHHWTDLPAGLKEVNRVLRQRGRFVMLSFTPQQLRGYWLHYYFPKMIERSMEVIPPLEDMIQLLKEAGFVGISTEPYYVRDDLQDHFLYSNKHRPEQYLIPEVRNGASSFTVFSDPAEIAIGLAQLESDIASGRIDEVMKHYENDLGDYLFLVAIKG